MSDLHEDLEAAHAEYHKQAVADADADADYERDRSLAYLKIRDEHPSATNPEVEARVKVTTAEQRRKRNIAKALAKSAELAWKTKQTKAMKVPVEGAF